jgi:hypothetical protein
MQTRTDFASPWSTGLKALTAGVLAVLVAVAVTRPGLLTYVGLGAILLLCAGFMVRGYRVQGRRLEVRRLGWSTAFDLADLKNLQVSPQAMDGSLRVFGIGGLFAYVGFFRNARLGWYRAYATDPRNSVVLTFGAGNVVVTPDSPQEFVAAIRASTAGVTAP